MQGNCRNDLMSNTVKVYKTVCELSGFRSPWWYQLEVVERNDGTSGSGRSQDGSGETSVEGEGSVSAGQFKRLKEASELKLCNHDSVSSPTFFIGLCVIVRHKY